MFRGKKEKVLWYIFFFFFIRKGNRKNGTLINDFSSNIEIIYMEYMENGAEIHDKIHENRRISWYSGHEYHVPL